MNQSRREMLKQALGALGGTAFRAWPFLAGLLAGTPGAFARSNLGGVPYGAAVNHWLYPKDAAYREALSANCRVVVSESGMKWDVVRAKRDHYDFAPGDQLVDFAMSRGMGVRGHTLVWYSALPAWTEQIASAAEAEREMTTTIQTMMTRYAGRVGSWDVVNEPIEDHPKTGLRESLWARHLGPDYIAIAFRAARAAAPKAELVLNEYGIETADEGARAKREGFRRLIRDLLDRGVPVDAIGIQGHLDGTGAVDRDGLQVFLREITGLGLKVLLTEIDVNDQELPGPPDLIDALVAARVYELLDTVFEVTRPSAVLTWGITDRYTWMPTWHARQDKLRNRCLPLDENMKAKPFMSVIRHFCGSPA